MEYITVNAANLAEEHICCAISNNTDVQVASKKAWLAQRFDEGLVFLKASERGKCFIEYLPAEMAWTPIEAANYHYIDCLWVSGRFKGHGYSRELLQACIDDSRAKGRLGLAVLSSRKKMSFLSDPKFLRYHGFQLADSCDPCFELLYLPLQEDAPPPRFKACVKQPQVAAPGLAIFYSHQCPFTAKYVPLLQSMAAERGVPLAVTHFETREQAQQAPAPCTSFSIFYDGLFLTNEIPSEKKFLQLLDEKGL